MIIKFVTLTPTGPSGSRLPKYSKMPITAEMNAIAEKQLKRLPLKFQGGTSGAIKIFRKKKFGDPGTYCQ